MKTSLLSILFVLLVAGASSAQQSPIVEGKYLGNLSANPYAPNSSSNPLGFGSPINPDSLNNPVGQYGSAVSNKSANNPLATNAPKLYDSDGTFRGNLSRNRLDPNSVNNPIGKYGSPVSPDSINNPLNRFKQDSPYNKFGRGLRVYGE